MKLVKISLIIIVISAIVFFVIDSLVTTPPPLTPSSPENQFVRRIQQEIDSLGKLPDTKFCQDFYKEIQYYINDYHADNRLDETPLGNNQWKKTLTSDLYSMYAEKFIRQAFYVFDHSEWNVEKLKFIRNEYQTLRNSEWLEKGSPVDQKFTEIQTIFSKYDEIQYFISTCNHFSYLSSRLSDRFPIADVKSKIARSRTYLSNNLENSYVSHCARLRDGLKEIPQKLFRAHVRHLDNKIQQWSGFYPNYNSHKDYLHNLNRPLSEEIEVLETNTYNISGYTYEYNRLKYKWITDNTEAYNYNYKPQE